MSYEKLGSLQLIPTAHLNEKNLWTNSSWGFEHVLDTMNYYWRCPDKNFPPQSTATRWRCNHFSKKWPKSKLDTTFTLKKTSVIPTFYKRNFFRDMIFLSFVVLRNLKGPKKGCCNEYMKKCFHGMSTVGLWQLLCQKIKMDYSWFFPRKLV